MDYYCDIHLPNDDEYLLDDKNTQPLLKQNNCIQCNLLANNIVVNSNLIDTEMSSPIVWSDGDYSNTLSNYHRSDQTYTSHETVSGILSNMANSTTTDNQSHCHGVKYPSPLKWVRRRLVFVVFICFIFMFAELIGGYMANSIALMTDSAHMLTDMLACSMALVAITIGSKKPTKHYPFGYHRAEVLGALFSVILIWILTFIFVYMAARRLYFDEYEIQSTTMLIIALLGLIINIIQVCILHGTFSIRDPSSHRHNHGNINLQAAAIHVLGDLLQSVGVVVAAIIIIYFPHLKMIDPICTFIFSVIVLFTTRKVFKDSIRILMEGFPVNLSYDAIYTSLQNLANVKHVHKLQVWALTSNHFVINVHLAVDPSTNRDALMENARVLLREKYGIYYTAFQVETYDQNIMLTCSECKIPE